MAAGGFREFVPGETLDEDKINDFLMQGVLVFAGTAARGSAITSPVEGQFAFLKNDDSLTFYDGSDWVALETGISYATISSTTGSPTVDTGVVIDGETYDIYTFTGDGSIVVSEGGLIDCYLLAGGGSGGASGSAGHNQGGGGGGGVLELTRLITAATYSITVGPGGAGVSSVNRGVAGGDSLIGGIFQALGGGQGTVAQQNIVGGGNGGGGGNGAPNNGGAGIKLADFVKGENGGDGSSTLNANNAGGGGGGGAEVGGNGTNVVGGKGGDGAATSITGTSVTLGGGGGGSRSNGSGGAGGAGGGTDGVSDNGASSAAAVNTGGGSGGGRSASGNGGSGIVIVRVQV